MNLNFLRMVCWLAMWLMFSATSIAQAAPDEAAKSPPLKTVSVTQLADAPLDPTPPPVAVPFTLPVEQHPWARFQPGAWRELRTVTVTFDEAGQAASTNITTQKEILQAVAEGKYILKVQATVDLGGKRIVGDWKDRVLHLATDSAGPIAASRRLEDETFLLAGRAVECQLFELHYNEGGRGLTERIHYDPQRFPFVLQRQTYVANDQQNQETTAENEQRMEVTAREVPYQVGEELLDCSCLRTYRHRPKGDTVRLAFSNRTIPGGEVAVWSTDFDAEGKRVRWSVTTLLTSGLSFGLTSGETPPEGSDSP